MKTTYENNDIKFIRYEENGKSYLVMVDKKKTVAPIPARAA